MIQFGFEHTHNDLFQELTRCCLKSAHRRKTKLSSISYSLSLSHTHTKNQRTSSKWLCLVQYILLPKAGQGKLYINLTSSIDNLNPQYHREG